MKVVNQHCPRKWTTSAFEVIQGCRFEFVQHWSYSKKAISTKKRYMLHNHWTTQFSPTQEAHKACTCPFHFCLFGAATLALSQEVKPCPLLSLSTILLHFLLGGFVSFFLRVSIQVQQHSCSTWTYLAHGKSTTIFSSSPCH